MSARFIARLAMILACLVMVWGGFAFTRHASQDRTIALVLPKIDTAAVDSIVLTRGKTLAALVRGPKGAWRVNGFPAERSGVDALLRGLADPSPVTELVAEQESSHERLGIGADSGLRVQILSHGHALLDITTGRQTADYGGLLIRKTDGEAVYALHGPLAAGLNRPGDEWRDKRIMGTEPDSIATADISHGSHAYTLRRNGAAWRFGSGAATDSVAVALLLARYRDVFASGFAAKGQPDSANFARGRGRVKLISKSGAAMANLVFDSTASGIWVRADTGGMVYRIEHDLWDQIAPAESTLKAKKK